MRVLVIGLGMTLLCASCAHEGHQPPLDLSEVPDSVLSRDLYIHVLTDVMLVEAARKQRVFRNDNDSLKIEQALSQVFEEHGTSAEAFEVAQRWWFGQGEAIVAILQEVTEAMSNQERDFENR